MQMIHSSVRSIGEVLAALKQEFPDVTISKIRFLESQGLIEPKRTASGYRQFSDDDIARLRYILRQQKENFLPLKVIKGRLDDKPQVTREVDSTIAKRSITSGNAEGQLMNLADLIRQSGLTESQVRDLESFGFLRGQRSNAGIWYGDDALTVAKIAARFLQFGIEPRHLRSFKTAAEREAQLYQQLVAPVRNQRNTQARIEATARLEELSGLGSTLREELLRAALAQS